MGNVLLNKIVQLQLTFNFIINGLNNMIPDNKIRILYKNRCVNLQTRTILRNKKNDIFLRIIPISVIIFRDKITN